MKKFLKMITAVIVVGATVLCSGCRAKYADESEITTYAQNLVKGETIECMGETEEHKFHFISKDRTLEFDVWSEAGTVNIDGANFGYTGDYNMYNDYLKNVNLYYEERVYRLLQKYGFDNYRKCEDYYSLRVMKFSLPEIMSQKQKENFNTFLAELKAIVKEERERHTANIYSQYTAMYNIEVWYKTSQGDYLRTVGLNNSDYTTDILPDDVVYKIENMHKSNMVVQNIITPLRDGILIEVEKEKN